MKTITVAGSKVLQTDAAAKQRLAKAIGRRIGANRDWILLNGGALSAGTDREPTAVDFFACQGAIEAGGKTGREPRDHVLTLHPQTSSHSLHNLGFVSVSKRRTPELRRFDLVCLADAVVTVEGLDGLNIVLELAMAMKHPLLPIPCTGGASQVAWEKYEAEIVETFSIGKSSVERELLLRGLHTPDVLADAVARLLAQVFAPTCFIAMPFSEDFDPVYRELIAPAIRAAQLDPIRVDALIGTDYIIHDIWRSIRGARVVIADITGLNPNVMYELGIAHAMAKPACILCTVDEGERFLDVLPFDIRMYRVIRYERKEPAGALETLTETLASMDGIPPPFGAPH